jgi:hypothetical protein
MVNLELGCWRMENPKVHMVLDESIKNGAMALKRIDESMRMTTKISRELSSISRILSRMLREASDVVIQLEFSLKLMFNRPITRDQGFFMMSCPSCARIFEEMGYSNW